MPHPGAARATPLGPPTLTAADLLLSKLQIVRFNRKDALDVLALASEYPLAEVDSNAISLPRILAHTSRDWGWWRTVTGNLQRLEEMLEFQLVQDDPPLGHARLLTAAERIGELRRVIDVAPKSVRWKLRQRFGDRLQWYDEPEEVAHDL